MTGKIACDGEPVTYGVINFLPAGGQPLGGEILSDGTYAAQLPAGTYQVRIDAPGPPPAGFKEGDAPPPPAARQAPAKYADYKTSGLSVTINAQSEPQQVDFVLP